MKKQTWKMHFNKGVPNIFGGIKYVNEDDVNDVLKLIRGNNLLEIAYEMLCWCVENGYVEHNS